MRPSISEFSYGFALTHELVLNLKGRLTAAPVLPSLIDEGRAGGGYDLKLSSPGRPLFIQFKLSDYLSRKSAKEWHLFGGSYYRFVITPRSRSQQHDLLIALDSPQNLVYYAAPAFHEVVELDQAFQLGAMLSRSVFARPRDIGSLRGPDRHVVVFEKGKHFGFVCSDPSEVIIASGDSAFLEWIVEDYESGDSLESGMVFESVISTLLQDYPYRDPGQYSELDPAERAGMLSRILLGAELLWVTRNME